MKSITLFIAVIFSAQAFADFEYPAAARNPEEAQLTKVSRRTSFYQHYARKEMAPAPVFPKIGMQDYFLPALSRMALKVDLESVNKSILDDRFRPWNPGTEIAILGPVCKRMGDYDFVLMGLIKMAYMDEESGRTLLSPAARYKLRHELLSQSGNNHYIKFRLKNCPPIKIKDTENHILMTEISRYLTNQLLLKESTQTGRRNDLYDNSINGFEDWFMNHLSEFMKFDFDEMNSRPYQGYTLIALANLYTYAEGPKVKELARMILDYLSAKAAVQSIGLRRYTPFRRRLENRLPETFTQVDTGMWWYSFHAGNSDYIDLAKNEKNDKVVVEDYIYLMASLDRYVIPKSIHEIFYQRKSPVFQTINGRDPEVYFLSENFLLTAGGRHRDVFGYFTNENDVWAVPTTLIGRSSGLGPASVFSITGKKKWNKRNNLCVAPNFSCGQNLYIPREYLGKEIKNGDWSFYETADFNLAIYQKGEFVLWEVQEPGDFSGFREKVLELNPVSFSPKLRNTYKTTNGHVIEFDWDVKKLNQNPIVSIDGKKMEADVTKWPLAEGNVIESKRDGKIIIKSLTDESELVLDQRDTMAPLRIEK